MKNFPPGSILWRIDGVALTSLIDCIDGHFLLKILNFLLFCLLILKVIKNSRFLKWHEPKHIN